MKPPFSIRKFYEELSTSLAGSTESQRRAWASIIIREQIELKHLSGLVEADRKTTLRFFWLISGIGMEDPVKLAAELPYLFTWFDRISSELQTSFANWWLMAGVPAENEARALDILFHWLVSPEINVTIKTRSMKVLFKLSHRYPELKNELRICLKDQKEKHSGPIQSSMSKLLNQLT